MANSIATIRKEVLKISDHIKQALPITARKYLTPERVSKVALMAIGKNPTLMQCTPGSLLQAIMDTASIGLEVGGALGHAYLVPYKNKRGQYQAQAIIGYRGYIALARRSGNIASVAANVVYEKDSFKIDLGSSQPPVHKPYLDGDRGKPKLVYAVAKFKDGSTHTEFMTMDQIDEIRERSRAKNSGPWVTDYLEMARKTVVRRAAKYWPISIEMAEAMELENKAENGDVIDADFQVGNLEPEEEPEQTSRTDEVLGKIQGNDKKETKRPTKSNEKAKPEAWYDSLWKHAKDYGMGHEEWLSMAKQLGIPGDPIDYSKVTKQQKARMTAFVTNWIADMEASADTTEPEALESDVPM